MDYHKWSIFTNVKTAGEQAFDAVRGIITIKPLFMDHPL
jgi:hypothetical protein